jgi:hypothetical protein
MGSTSTRKVLSEGLNPIAMMATRQAVLMHIVTALVIGSEFSKKLVIGFAEEIQPDIREHHSPAVVYAA